MSVYGCLRTVYCVLRTENILVCCDCVGSDRAAGVREVQALDLMTCAIPMTGGHACGDGRPCSRLPRSV